MNKLAIVAIAGCLSSPALVWAELKDEIVGTWRLVSLYNEADGKKTHLYGEHPLGITVYDKSGNYISYISKAELPKFAVANRLKGTDAEYRAVVQGIIAGYGTYTVQGDKVSVKFLGSSYPNRMGNTESRVVKISGDEMTVTNPTAASGGTAYSKLVRLK